jgi:hypothetical protein
MRIVFAIMAIIAMASASVFAGRCDCNRVRIKNTTHYAVNVELVGQNVRQTVQPDGWLDCNVFGPDRVTVRLRLNGVTRDYEVSANTNCVSNGRIVRLDAGIVGIQPF